MRKFIGHKGIINSVIFSPDGKNIVSRAEDNTLKVWDVHTGRCINTLRGHSGGVGTHLYSTDGRYLISGANGQIKIWDAHTWECIRTMGECTKHRFFRCSIACSSDGNYLASSWDRIVKIWDMRTGECIRTRSNSYCITCVAYSPDGRYLAMGESLDYKIWDLHTGGCRNAIGIPVGAYCTAYSPDGKYLAYVCIRESTIRVLAADTRACICTIPTQIDGGGGYPRVFFSSDCKYLAIVPKRKRETKIWDIKTGQCVRTVNGYVDWALPTTCSPDGKYSVIGKMKNNEIVITAPIQSIESLLSVHKLTAEQWMLLYLLSHSHKSTSYEKFYKFMSFYLPWVSNYGEEITDKLNEPLPNIYQEEFMKLHPDLQRLLSTKFGFNIPRL